MGILILLKHSLKLLLCDKVLITYKMEHAFIFYFILVLPNSYVIFPAFNLRFAIYLRLEGT